VSNGRMRGDVITFSAGGVDYTGRVNGTTMSGKTGSGSWTATRGGKPAAR
jgi:hypothetical protein